MISGRGQSLSVWMVIFTIIVFLSLALRFWAKSVQGRKWRVDDYFIILAWASLMAMQGTSWWAIRHGLGAMSTQLSLDDISINMKLYLSAGVTWTFATVSCKVAMLWLYREIFTLRWFRVLIDVSIATNIAYMFVFIPIFMTVCRPISSAWDPVLSQTDCQPSTRQEFASVGVNMFLDLAIVLLPLPVIWQLRMPVRKKVVVSAMVSLGLAIVGVMAWRISTTVAAANDKPDFTHHLYITALQSHLEVWLGIVATNLPTLAPLRDRFFGRREPKTYGSGGSYRLGNVSGGSRGAAAPRDRYVSFGSDDEDKKPVFDGRERA